MNPRRRLCRPAGALDRDEIAGAEVGEAGGVEGRASPQVTTLLTITAQAQGERVVNAVAEWTFNRNACMDLPLSDDHCKTAIELTHELLGMGWCFGRIDDPGYSAWQWHKCNSHSIPNGEGALYAITRMHDR